MITHRESFDHRSVVPPCLEHLGFTHHRSLKEEGIYWHDTKGLVDVFYHNFYRLKFNTLSREWAFTYMDREVNDTMHRIKHFGQQVPTADELTATLVEFGVPEAVAYRRNQRIDSVLNNSQAI